MSDKMEKVVKQRIQQTIARYDEMNFHDPAVVTLVTSTVLLELANIQDQYENFDGDFEFNWDPDPYMTISWWINGVSNGVEQFTFRFDPIRIEGASTDDAIAAYERAMGIL